MPAESRLTDEEIASEWHAYGAGVVHPTPLHAIEFARRIERIVMDRERKRAARLVRDSGVGLLPNFPNTAAAIKTLCAAILRDDGASDDKEGGR